MKNFIVPDFPKKIIVGVQDGLCNLKCPMCFVHSKQDASFEYKKGQMPLVKFIKLLDEIKNYGQVRINPTIWAETFLIKEFEKYILAVKERKISLEMHTNGLLLSKEKAKFIVDVAVDNLSFSIDAFTNETFNKVRGSMDFEKLKNNILELLKIRGSNNKPRIGVSMVLCDDNREEEKDFINYWLQYVDVIRINEQYKKDLSIDIKASKGNLQRIPCSALYDTIAISHDGDVSICCLDSKASICVGNVFQEGIKKVWQGSALNRIRKLHEMGKYNEINLCKGCDYWQNYQYEEEIKDNVLIRKSSIMTFYNPLNRINNWDSCDCVVKKEIRGSNDGK